MKPTKDSDLLVGVGDIADIIGLKKETVWVMSSRGQLPPPEFVINSGRTKVWRRTTIHTWAEQRGTK